jgi:FMN phosphatase YigB (HAD superfamily)
MMDAAPPPRAVFLDVGGPVYDDDDYTQAVLAALDELRAREGLPPTDRAAFRAVYDRLRTAQAGSFRTALCETFLPRGVAARAELHDLTARSWTHPPGSLAPDALPFVRAVAPHAVVGILANQGAQVVDELRRDGFGPLITVWGVSALVGHEKPSPELFRWCLAEAGVAPGEAVHVGNRLDNDVRPARRLGLRTVWLLRGEAPDDPTPDQRAEADLVVTSLDGLAELLFPGTRGTGPR